MDYGIQNSHHLPAAPQTLLQSQSHSHPQPQPQPQQPHAAPAHLYSAYYTNPNPNPYPNPIVKHDDPSPSGLVYADGSIALQGGYDGQAVSYGAYQQQQQQHAAAYPYAQALAAASFQQAKRKFKIHSNMLDLEEKKQRVIEGGASADAVRVCTICNVVCNSAKVFASHLSGEKHALKALGTNYRTMAPKVMAHIKKISNAKKSAAPKPPFNIATSFTKAAKPVENFTCEVCKIDCNSIEVLNTHKMGKKHKAKLQKLQEKITPKPSVASAGHDETTNLESQKKKPPGKECVQVKKEKVVQGGAAEEDIVICNLCNIVCNSKSVYESHIKGRKHLSMIKKQDT